MSTLPAEPLCLVFELSLPPSSASNFKKRSQILRNFSLTCRSWRVTAQRLLFAQPVFRVKTSKAEEITRYFELVEGKGVDYSPTHLCANVRRFGMYFDMVRIPAGVEANLAATLKSLSLTCTKVDEGILMGLTGLESLSLTVVMFNPAAATQSAPFVNLTDLSIALMGDYLPHALLPPQLPRLKRLAIDTSPTIHEKYYPFEEIARLLQTQLDFFSGDIRADMYYEKDSKLVADKTLFTLDRSDILRELDFGGPLKYAKINDWNDLIDGNYGNKTDWVLRDLWEFLTCMGRGMEVLVVPARWQRSRQLWKEFEKILRDDAPKLRVLLEGDISDRVPHPVMSAGDCGISLVFKEYLRVQAKQN